MKKHERIFLAASSHGKTFGNLHAASMGVRLFHGVSTSKLRLFLKHDEAPMYKNHVYAELVRRKTR